MAEFEVAPGRYVISIHGYDEIGNDPAKIRNFLEGQKRSFIGSGRGRVLAAYSRGIDPELEERLGSNMLELAFLEGDKDFIDLILKQTTMGDKK